VQLLIGLHITHPTIHIAHALSPKVNGYHGQLRRRQCSSKSIFTPEIPASGRDLSLRSLTARNWAFTWRCRGRDRRCAHASGRTCAQSDPTLLGQPGGCSPHVSQHDGLLSSCMGRWLPLRRIRHLYPLRHLFTGRPKGILDAGDPCPLGAFLPLTAFAALLRTLRVSRLHLLSRKHYTRYLISSAPARNPAFLFPVRMLQQRPSLRSCQLADLLAIKSRLRGSAADGARAAALLAAAVLVSAAPLAQPLAAPSSWIITSHSPRTSHAADKRISYHGDQPMTRRRHIRENSRPRN
jgi:hypothetical protein